ncbi:MAG: tRNA pseudouridine(38-40) synthase TruA [Erysipelotrichaceae bacterium]|nr:tRNA pseudouridine(38-40) synthase TruA [Erysipelotrichaceae bacterium]
MTRYKVTLSYDGTAYHGWQSQKNHVTLQDTIQQAFLLFQPQPVKIMASGRTDQHVHALNQVFHFDSDIAMSEEKWKLALNAYLPDDIYIKKVEKAADTFHARYDAVKKSYLYLLNMGEYDPFRRDHIYQYNRHLDIEKMQEAALIFLGEHDFTSFCSNRIADTPNQCRTIYNISITVDQDIVRFFFEGNGFMRYMVRMLVGTLIEVGKNKLTLEQVQGMLAAADKTVCHFKAKPEGLYLVSVSYYEN